MAKDPAQRPRSADELAKMLLPFAGQRVQISYGPELGIGSDSTAPGQPFDDAQGPSTLTPSSHTLTGERPIAAKRWALGLLGAAALGGLLLWMRGQPPQPTAADVPQLPTPPIQDPTPPLDPRPPLDMAPRAPELPKVPIAPEKPDAGSVAPKSEPTTTTKRPHSPRPSGKPLKPKPVEPRPEEQGAHDDVWDSRR
jgi:hypothetical protein